MSAREEWLEHCREVFRNMPGGPPGSYQLMRMPPELKTIQLKKGSELSLPPEVGNRAGYYLQRLSRAANRRKELHAFIRQTLRASAHRSVFSTHRGIP